MFLLTILSVTAVATGTALISLSRVPGATDNRAWTSMQLSSAIENLRDRTYVTLVSGSSTSDADPNNVTYPITWTVTEINPSLPTSVPPVVMSNSGFKRVVVVMNGQTFETRVSQ